MCKLGLRPRYSFSGNICFKFSAFCLFSVLCLITKEDLVLPGVGVLLLSDDTEEGGVGEGQRLYGAHAASGATAFQRIRRTAANEKLC